MLLKLWLYGTFLLKSTVWKDFQIGIKMMEWQTIIQITVTSSDFKMLLKIVSNIGFDFSHTYRIN